MRRSIFQIADFRLQIDCRLQIVQMADRFSDGRLMRRLAWLAFGAAVGGLVVLERLRPLRPPKDPAPLRVGRNLTIGALAAATTAASEMPLIAPVQRLVGRRRIGLLHLVRLARPLRIVLGFLLLDYTLYLWHWLNHRVPSLWRFHAVHHVDLDLDSSTGIRFHFGELALAAGFRAAQILVLGVDDDTLRVWQKCLLLSVIFHHSNLELPPEVERRLQFLVVTPRMHGIHHSTRGDETNTNFSSLLSCWDRLHRSLRLDVPQPAITIGVEGFLDPAEVTLERSLALPFGSGRPLAPPANQRDAAQSKTKSSADVLGTKKKSWAGAQPSARSTASSVDATARGS
jgi:sterol desaturase/sphingolipid hydroxylase (fatty acid hydroxylase superfamily)